MDWTELSDIERIIMISQFKILAKLDPKHRAGYEHRADCLEHGYHALLPLPSPPPALPVERLQFVRQVIGEHLIRGMEFNGFKNEWANDYAEFIAKHEGLTPKRGEGEPLSDDEYGAMLRREPSLRVVENVE